MRRRLALGLSVAVLLAGAVAARLATAGSAPARALPATPHEALTTTAAELQARGRVILVTLDGARWQDVLDLPGTLAEARERPLLAHTLSLVRAQGVALRGTTSSRVPLSLPGYQALAAGRPTACEDNDCPRIEAETLAEGLALRLRLRPEQVAVFASWSRLARAAAAQDGRVLVDAPADGLHPGGPPWDDARWDAETVQRAVEHFRAHRPRFLHLALLDMDERAHLREPAGVAAALRQADGAVARLLEEVARLPEEERRLTTVLVTADHGRGPGPLWSDHGPYAASRDLFLLAFGPLVAGGEGPFTQADVRPTVERLLGLSPSACGGEGCGRALLPVVGELPHSD